MTSPVSLEGQDRYRPITATDFTLIPHLRVDIVPEAVVAADR